MDSLSMQPALHGIPAAAPQTTAKQAWPGLTAVWARHEDEVRAAQALRWRVFVDELGARLRPPAGTPPGLDVDLFDAHCEHLLVRTAETDGWPSQVVGTYRLLTPAAARRLGGLYTDQAFDLVRLRALRPQLAELGRSCTAPGWRQGGVMLMLWAALGQFIQRNGIEQVIGCASVSMADGGHQAADLWRSLAQRHLASAQHQVRPRLPLPVHVLGFGRDVEPPALIKGYLRCGGEVLGPPAWDTEFGCADLPMMLHLNRMNDAYRRRLLGD